MDILTDAFPEPVLASKRIRIAAFITDVIIWYVLGFTIGLLLAQNETYAGSTGSGISIGFSLSGFPALVMMAAWFLLFPVMEGLTGKTIGKRIFRISVVKEDHSPVTVGRSVARHLFYLIDILFLVGLIVASTNRKKQRIGDLVADTLVVKD